MRRRTLMTILAGAPVMSAMPALGQTPPGRDDGAAVRGWAEECVAAWAASDAERMFRSAAEDVEWINIVGMHWRGKADVVEAHRIFLTTMFRNVPLELREIETVRAVGAEVVVAVVRWSVGQFTTPTGHVIPPSDDRMTLVFRRGPQGLILAHGANIQIDPVAQASNPVRSVG